MIDIAQSILAFIVALGVLITFHEFGHYWVARRFDVKILRFSIGFGRPIYKRVFGKDQTEFVIAALPLGGYVKMLDSREAEVNQEEAAREFNQKPLQQRFAIVAAGPVFNFIFAIFAYCLIFVIGVNGLKPIVGEIRPNSISASAGLEEDDQILSINGVKTPTWSAVIDKLVNHTVGAEQITLQVADRNSAVQTLTMDLAQVSIDEMAEGKLLDTLGLNIIELKLPPVIGEVLSGGAAERAGLLANDRILAVDGNSVETWNDWVATIRANAGNTLAVEILRSGNLLNLSLTPQEFITENETQGRIGAAAKRPEGMFDEYFTKEAYSPPVALLKAIQKTWEMSVLTLRVLGKMIVGEASVKNLSGPISIAQYAGQSAGIGLAAFLGFMAIVSVSLGVLNLLPVPLLDGGHLLYYVIEFITGRPVSDATQVLGQQIGLVLLLSLMGLAFYNDIIRLLG